MTTLSANIPDTLLHYAQKLADKEKISLDQFIAMALAGQISSWQTAQNIAERSNGGDWNKAREILAKGSDLEPEPEDRL
ncbi:MAG: hypothetical protein ABL999_01300 [Pyrinomonadaceae bacterium]